MTLVFNSFPKQGIALAHCPICGFEKRIPIAKMDKVKCYCEEE